VRAPLADLRALAATVGNDHLRVIVETGAPIPGLADEVRKILPNAVQVQLAVQPGGDGANGGAEGATPLRLKAGGPDELYAEYHQSRHGCDPAPALLALFRELYGAAAAEEKA
jgi:hypothetical protein